MKFFGITWAIGCAMLLFAAAAPAFDGPDGRLTQVSGGASVSHGCVTDDGSAGACLDGRALASPGAIDIAVSPDGNQVYVAGDAGVAVLQRDFSTGALVQSFGGDGCITSSGTAGGFPCVAMPGLGASYGIAVSPDGANVYATSVAGDFVAAFSRAPFTGALTTIGTFGGAGMDGPRAIAVAPDGRDVYVTSDGDDAVAAFHRNPDGTLTQAAAPNGCVSDDGTSSGGACRDGNDAVLSDGDEMPLAVSPDGADVYVAGDDGLLSFDRASDGTLTESGCLAASPAPPGCAAAVGLEAPTGVAVSPGGSHVYATSATLDSIGYYGRGAGGALTAPGACVSNSGTGCGGATAAGLNGPAGLAFSPDGTSLYAASGLGAGQAKAIDAFSLDSGGRPLQLGSGAGCISETPGSPPSTAGCADGKALTGAVAVVVSPDGNHVYSAAVAPTDGVASFARTNPPDTAISAAPRARTRHRKVRFAFAATRPTAFFFCKLDNAPFGVCVSPFRSAKLKRGAHTFQVYGVGVSGQADPTPAVYRFTIGRGSGKESRAGHRKHHKRRPARPPKHRRV